MNEVMLKKIVYTKLILFVQSFMIIQRSGGHMTFLTVNHIAKVHMTSTSPVLIALLTEASCFSC